MTYQIPGSRFLADDDGDVIGVKDHDGDEHNFVLGSPAWLDIDFPIIIRAVGPNIPALATLQGTIQAPQWAVNDYANLEGQEMIHGWLEGSEGRWHLHLVTNGLDATDRFVKFQLEWCFATPGDAIPTDTITTETEFTIPANTPDRTHLIVSLSSAEMPDAKITTHVWARLTRVASAGTAPTNSPFVTMLQMHIQVDTTGSRTLFVK